MNNLICNTFLSTTIISWRIKFLRCITSFDTSRTISFFCDNALTVIYRNFHCYLLQFYFTENFRTLTFYSIFGASVAYVNIVNARVDRKTPPLTAICIDLSLSSLLNFRPASQASKVEFSIKV